MADPVADFLRTKTVRRAIALGSFFAFLIVFRRLAPLLVFFLAFSHALAAATRWTVRTTRLPHKLAVLILVLLIVGVVGGGIALGIGSSIHSVVQFRETLPDKIALIKQAPLYLQIQEHLHDTDRYIDTAKQYATDAVGYVTAFGHLLLHALIGFILSVVYLLEEDELAAWSLTIDPRSLIGTLMRWLGHVADAVVLTLQLQIIVAALNAMFTLPILLVLRLPHPGALALMIFASSLVPVVGNLVSGAVLTVLAFNTRGFVGVGVFLALTFVLHKIESYYLNPRLTARHVHLPGLVLIASLIAWEHLLGIVGLFVSFPFLFVATRIRRELREEDEAQPPAATPVTPG